MDIAPTTRMYAYRVTVLRCCLEWRDQRDPFSWLMPAQRVAWLSSFKHMTRSADFVLQASQLRRLRHYIAHGPRCRFCLLRISLQKERAGIMAMVSSKVRATHRKIATIWKTFVSVITPQNRKLSHRLQESLSVDEYTVIKNLYRYQAANSLPAVGFMSKQSSLTKAAPTYTSNCQKEPLRA